MASKTENTNLIWQSAFFIIPGVILIGLAEIYSDNSVEQILIAGLIGVFGALLGAVFSHFAKSKSNIIKTSLLLLLFGLCIAILIIETKRNQSILETCEICGYKAIRRTGNQCNYCGGFTWSEKKKIKGYDNKTEWLKEEQLSWFSLDSFTGNENFYNPPIDEGYIKDKNWRPLVTEEEIKNEMNYED